MTTKITQLYNIDIATVHTLNEIVIDKDNNGILSVGDTVMDVKIEKSDFSSASALEDYLSQVSNRRVEILTTESGMTHYLAFSNIGDANQLAGVFRIAKWGNCSSFYGYDYDYECISDDARYDPNYDHSEPELDRTKDRLIFSANQYSSEEDAKRISELWLKHKLNGELLRYPTEYDFDKAQRAAKKIESTKYYGCP